MKSFNIVIAKFTLKEANMVSLFHGQDKFFE